jgi:hypothetical protein
VPLHGIPPWRHRVSSFLALKRWGDGSVYDISKAFDDFQNRKKYSSFTLETIESIPDDKLVQAVIDYIIDEIIKDDYANEYEIIKKQSLGIQYIWAIWGLEAEVNNGGFNQYFYNLSGQFAEEAYNGCMAIGAPRMAEIVESAIKTLFKEIDLYKKTKAAGTIEAFMDSYNETELGQWDDEFYKYPEDLSILMVKYIKNNYQEFIK